MTHILGPKSTASQRNKLVVVANLSASLRRLLAEAWGFEIATAG